MILQAQILLGNTLFVYNTTRVYYRSNKPKKLHFHCILACSIFVPHFALNRMSVTASCPIKSPNIPEMRFLFVIPVFNIKLA